MLADSLAMFSCDLTLIQGKEKYSGSNGGLVVKRDGQWMIKKTGYERTYVEIRPYEKPTAFHSRWAGR